MFHTGNWFVWLFYEAHQVCFGKKMPSFMLLITFIVSQCKIKIKQVTIKKISTSYFVLNEFYQSICISGDLIWFKNSYVISIDFICKYFLWHGNLYNFTAVIGQTLMQHLLLKKQITLAGCMRSYFLVPLYCYDSQRSHNWVALLVGSVNSF